MRRDPVRYPGVFAVRVDPAGNLRLFARGRFGWMRQRAFHPAEEWASVTLIEAGAMVELRQDVAFESSMHAERDYRMGLPKPRTDRQGGKRVTRKAEQPKLRGA